MKIFKLFMYFSGILFWLIVISVFFPSNFMGFIGLIGIYMMAFGFPLIFFTLSIGIILFAFYIIIYYKKFVRFDRFVKSKQGEEGK